MSGAVSCAVSEPGIALDRLGVGFARRGRVERTVLREVSARARPGELTVVLGPNGTGKSTLLHTIAGLRRPLGGTVRLDGDELSRLTRRELATRLAVVLTARPDVGLLSVRELVGLGRHPHTSVRGELRADDDAVVDWALAAVDAGHLADRPTAALSDGERQRVFVARALAQEPSIVLLDEPTAFLDAPARVALTGLLRRLAGGGLTVVASTHDLELALRVADAVWLVDRDGGLHAGTPEELTLDGRLAAVFDGPDLAFDARGGGFTLRLDAVGTAYVDAPEPRRSVLGRALARAGWRPLGESERVDADLVVTDRAGRLTVRLGDLRAEPSHVAEAVAWAAEHAARRAGRRTPEIPAPRRITTL